MNVNKNGLCDRFVTVSLFSFVYRNLAVIHVLLARSLGIRFLRMQFFCTFFCSTARYINSILSTKSLETGKLSLLSFPFCFVPLSVCH